MLGLGKVLGIVLKLAANVGGPASVWCLVSITHRGICVGIVMFWAYFASAL